MDHNPSSVSDEEAPANVSWRLLQIGSFCTRLELRDAAFELPTLSRESGQNVRHVKTSVAAIFFFWLEKKRLQKKNSLFVECCQQSRVKDVFLGLPAVVSEKKRHEE